MLDPAYRAAATALVACVQRIGARGWCDGTAGNFSVRLEGEPLRLLITPSGADKRTLDADHLLVIGADARCVGPSAREPSAEAALHVAIARETGAAAVLHTHSVWGTLCGEHFRDAGSLRIGGYEMLKGIAGITSHEEQVHVPVVPNTQDMQLLASQVRHAVRERPETRGLLIAGHGLYAWGAGLAEAERHVEIFEFLFEIVGRRLPLAPFAV